ncbi:orotidine 5'-phosphate decarboxylase [Candidatus Dependentiae bacterium]|nr:orotidine 5'-phosphate decarboxylase [Candidatus Dependentiae bacterium]
MKLQISYDFTNLSQALEIAKKTALFADILEVGTPLLIAEGIRAIESFKNTFPDKPIIADTKIVDRVSDVIPMLAKAGASAVTILYGTSNSVIQKAASIAHKHDMKVILDLIDAETMGQAARDAESLDVDSILFHYPHETSEFYSNIDQWEIVRGNTDLPIFVSGRITKKQILGIKALKPQGMVIGEAITKADDPAAEAHYFKEKLTPRT